MATNGYYSDGRQYAKRARADAPPYARLFESMRAGRQRMERHRRERFRALKAYCGNHYSDNGADDPTPINLIDRYVQVMSKFLVPACPRADIVSRDQKQAAAVRGMKDWLNVHLKKTYFEDTLSEWVVNAFFGTSVMKVGLTTPADSATTGYTLRAGLPFAEPIDADDWVFDPGAKNVKRAAWVAHRYRIAVEVARKLDYFDSKERKKIVPDSPGSVMFNAEGDERVESIGRGNGGYGDGCDYRDMADLWEVYVPDLKKVYTFRASSGGGVPPAEAKPLRVQEWVGPACGPYHYLTLAPVPGNAYGKGVLLDLLPLHNAVNQAYTKLIDQLLRQKTVYAGRDVEDSLALINASDGEAVKLDSIDALQELKYGGADQASAAFSVHLSDVFNAAAGNLAVLSGSGQQAKTATQEKLLSENASSGVAGMQGKTVAATSRVLEALCWYYWYHPEMVMESNRTVPGLPDVSRQVRVYPGTFPDRNKLRRDGDFESLDCRVDPYSMVFKTPQQRLSGIMTVLDKFVPLSPVLERQNIRIDYQEVVKTIAELMDEPVIERIFTVAPTPETPRPPGGDGGGMSMKPASTERNYTRTSVGQDTEANRYAEMANAGAEAAAAE